MSRTDGIEAALAGLFPPGTAVAAVRIGAAPEPDPAEAAAVAGAVPLRRAEFAAGREAARRAMAALGLAPVAVPMGADRAPLWPEGVAGSIAHAGGRGGLAAAALRRGAPLGLDIEEDAAIEPALWPEICRPEELARLPGPDRGRAVRRLFAAKEAAYKAQYPLTGALFGFHAMAVEPVPGGFLARLTQEAAGPAGRLPAGFALAGRWASAGGLVLAGVAA